MSAKVGTTEKRILLLQFNTVWGGTDTLYFKPVPIEYVQADSENPFQCNIITSPLSWK